MAKKTTKRTAKKAGKTAGKRVATTPEAPIRAGAARRAGFSGFATPAAGSPATVANTDESMDGKTDAQIVARIKMQVDLGNRVEFYIENGTLFMGVR